MGFKETKSEIDPSAIKSHQSEDYQNPTEIHEIILSLEKGGKTPIPSSIKSIFTGDSTPASILKYGELTVSQLRRSKKFGNAKTYENVLSRLSRFLNGVDCAFDKIDYSFINEFQAQLLSDGLKINTVSVYLRTIRALYNRAIKDGVAGRSDYPFENFRIKSEPTQRPSYAYIIHTMSP